MTTYINNTKLNKYALDFEELSKEKELAKKFLAKSYIDSRMFDNAEKTIEELIEQDDGYKIFLADLYFAKGEYDKAVEYFEEYCPSDSEHYRHPQFDYKKAVAYFKTGQTANCEEQAKRIGIRLGWDRFYGLDYIESEGVERIAEIDEVIYSAAKEKSLLKFDKLSVALKRTPYIIWTTLLQYRQFILAFYIIFSGCFKELFRIHTYHGAVKDNWQGIVSSLKIVNVPITAAAVVGAVSLIVIWLSEPGFWSRKRELKLRIVFYILLCNVCVGVLSSLIKGLAFLSFESYSFVGVLFAPVFTFLCWTLLCLDWLVHIPKPLEK